MTTTSEPALTRIQEFTDTMQEAGVLVGSAGEALHWYEPPGRSAGFLPDTGDLWDRIWSQRDEVIGFAHSHPGAGLPGPSWEDVTTFAAVELGLGRRLSWWITSADGLVVVTWMGPGKYQYIADERIDGKPSWLDELRLRSCYQNTL